MAGGSEKSKKGSGDDIFAMISQHNRGKAIPVAHISRVVKEKPETAAALSKLHNPVVRRADFNDKNAALGLVNASDVLNLAQRTRNRIQDNRNILRLFPDLELALMIVISSILSPKDMIGTNFIYRCETDRFDADLVNKLVAFFQEYMEKNYKVKKHAYKKLRDILAEKGAHVRLILPENVIDEQINGRPQITTEDAKVIFEPIFESLDKRKVNNIGILGVPTAVRVIKSKTREVDEKSKGWQAEKAVVEFSMETAGLTHADMSAYRSSEYNDALVLGMEDGKLLTEPLVTLNDNFHLLKFPVYNDLLTKSKLNDALSYGLRRKRNTGETLSMESAISDAQFRAMAYKGARPEGDPFVVLPTRLNTFRKSVSRPIDMEVSPAAALPVYLPGDEDNHQGYIFINDQDGHFLGDTIRDAYGGLQGLDPFKNTLSGQNLQQSQGSALLDRARRNLIGLNQEPSLSNMAVMTASIVERDLRDRFRSGVYGRELEIGSNDLIYRIMIARLWENKMTRLVYVPKEYVAYFSLRRFENGIGRSFLDDISILASIRGVVMMSTVYAYTTNAINQTNVKVNLEPNDPDPFGTAEQVAHEIVRLKQQYIPIGLNNPADHMDWIQRAGINLQFTGHPDFPEVSMEFENKSAQKQLPDSELNDQLRKLMYMAFSLSPESVEAGFSGNFATTDILNNVLFSRRMVMFGEEFSACETDYEQKIAMVDPHLREEMINIMRENITAIEKLVPDNEKHLLKEDEEDYLDRLYDYFIKCMIIELPKPDAKSLESQAQAFDAQEQAIDKALDTMYFGSDLLSADLVGEASSAAATLKAIAKSAELRRWCADNGYLPELANLLSTGDAHDDANNFSEQQKLFIGGLARTVIEVLAKAKKIKLAATNDYQKITSDTPEDDGSGSGDASGSEAPADDTGTQSQTQTQSSDETGTQTQTGDSGGGEDLGSDLMSGL